MSLKEPLVGEKNSYVCVMGGMLEQTGDGKVPYEEGLRKCMVAKEDMGLEEFLRVVKEITESNLSERKLWYSLKYDGQMLMAIEGDENVRMIFKGNDVHCYLYVGGNDDPRRRAQKGVVACKG